MVQEVSLKIVTCDEECTIKLFDIKSGGTSWVLILEQNAASTYGLPALSSCIVPAGALFAECNVPPDAPLSTVRFFS